LALSMTATVLAIKALCGENILKDLQEVERGLIKGAFGEWRSKHLYDLSVTQGFFVHSLCFSSDFLPIIELRE
jgi:hypothetical protein